MNYINLTNDELMAEPLLKGEGNGYARELLRRMKILERNNKITITTNMSDIHRQAVEDIELYILTTGQCLEDLLSSYVVVYGVEDTVKNCIILDIEGVVKYDDDVEEELVTEVLNVVDEHSSDVCFNMEFLIRNDYDLEDAFKQYLYNATITRLDNERYDTGGGK